MPAAPPRGPRPTLRTLADLTGMSMSTISLALRGGENLREETRERILQVARQIGYVPDRAGVRLRTGRTNTVALILDGAEDSLGFSRRLIHGISDGIRARDITLNVLPEFDRSASEAAIGRIVGGQSVDGLIITHTAPQDPRVRLLIEAGMPFVTHGRTEFYTSHAYHDYDSAGFVRMGLARLAALGARRVVAVIADNNTYNYHRVRRSFEDGARALGLEAHVLDDSATGEDHIAAMRRAGLVMAQDPDRPDGILCESELAGIGLASGLRDGGVQMGGAVRMVCKQTSGLLHTLFPGIDGIAERVYESGLELARLLLLRIDGAEVSQLQTLSAPVPLF